MHTHYRDPETRCGADAEASRIHVRISGLIWFHELSLANFPVVYFDISLSPPCSHLLYSALASKLHKFIPTQNTSSLTTQSYH